MGGGSGDGGAVLNDGGLAAAAPDDPPTPTAFPDPGCAANPAMLPPPNLIDPTLAPEKDPVRAGPAGTGGGDIEENEEEDEEDPSAPPAQAAVGSRLEPLAPPLLVMPPLLALPMPPPPALLPPLLFPTIGVPKLEPKLLPPPPPPPLGPPFRIETPPFVRIRGISSRSVSPGICWMRDWRGTGGDGRPMRVEYRLKEPLKNKWPLECAGASRL